MFYIAFLSLDFLLLIVCSSPIKKFCWYESKVSPLLLVSCSLIQSVTSGGLSLHQTFMLPLAQGSSCFYCLNFVPNAYMNVALGWKMHLALSLFSALFSQLGSFLLDGNASFSCTGEEPRVNHGW